MAPCRLLRRVWKLLAGDLRVVLVIPTQEESVRVTQSEIEAGGMRAKSDRLRLIKAEAACVFEPDMY